MTRLSSSTYYSKPKVPREARERADAELRDRIEKVQCEYGAGTGYRYVLRYLRRAGINAGERRIRRIMKKYDLQAKIKRKSSTYPVLTAVARVLNSAGV